MPVFKTEVEKAGTDRVYVFKCLTEADLSERLIRFVLLHEERKIRMFIRTVVEHVLKVGHNVFLLEEITFVLGLFELCKHLLDDLALTPFDVPVFCFCVFSAHDSGPMRFCLALKELFLYNSCIN